MRATISMLVLAAVLGGCSDDPASKPRGSASPRDDSPPPRSGLALREGSASIEISGSVSYSARLDFDADASQFTESPGGFALFYRKGTDVLTLGGATFTGTQKTSKTHVLGFSVSVDGEIKAVTSNAGQCSVTLGRAGSAVTGSFRCSGLQAADGTRFDASGTFDAR